MDEACLNVGKTTDRMLLDAMDQKLKGNKHYTSKALDSSQKQLELHQEFMIKHYAGNVVYKIDGFIDKNRDTLFQDFKRLLFNSNNEIIR